MILKPGEYRYENDILTRLWQGHPDDVPEIPIGFLRTVIEYKSEVLVAIEDEQMRYNVTA